MLNFKHKKIKIKPVSKRNFLFCYFPMANEIWGLWEGLDIGGQPRSDINKVTEEAVRRIQDQSKKAQQVHQQIQQDKKNNTAIAQFLSFLLKEIQDEKIISLLYDVFFKSKNPETWVTYLRKKINTPIIIWFFYPFYQKEAEQFKVSPLFQKLLIQSHTLDIHEYIAYIKKLAMTYHDNVALNQEHLLKLLSKIITYFEFDGKKLSDGEHEISIAQIKKELL